MEEMVLSLKYADRYSLRERRTKSKMSLNQVFFQMAQGL